MELTRRIISDIIHMYEMGHDVEQIMFSLGMAFEGEED